MTTRGGRANIQERSETLARHFATPARERATASRERVARSMLADVAHARSAYDAIKALVLRDGARRGDGVSRVLSRGTRGDGDGDARARAMDKSTQDARVKALFAALLTARSVKNDSRAVEVTKGVYIGSVGAAKNVEALRELGVTHVLTACGGMPREGFYPDDFEYATCAVDDKPDAAIDEHFDRCFDFIRDALARDGKVLVHCFQGKSRSATICAMYMMRALGMDLDEAMTAIREVRPCAQPNSGFIRALRALERSLAARSVPSGDESPKKKTKTTAPTRAR